MQPLLGFLGPRPGVLCFGFKLRDAFLSSSKLKRSLVREPQRDLRLPFRSGCRSPDCVERCPSSVFQSVAGAVRKSNNRLRCRVSA
jgi:hypothetical protein